MARKGNQHRNGINRNAAEPKNKVSDISDRESSGVCELKFTNLNHPKDDKQGKLSTPREEDSMNKNKSSGKRSKQKHALSRDNSVDKSSAEIPRKLGDSAGDNFTSDSSNIVNENLPGRVYEGEVINDDIQRHASPNLVAVVKLKEAASYALKTVTAWLEQQKPLFRAATSAIYKAHSYVRGKVDETYPIIWSWTLNFGKVMFFISMIWLDCTIRGLDSLLRLGATSFFTILWCSILSITAMIGFTKMLMIMVIVVLLGFFIGIGLALLLIAIMALLMLWLYGSFWTTGLVFLFGGGSFYFGHERIALLVTTIYSIYSTKGYVGWLGLFLGLNLSFISSDVLMLFLKNSAGDRNSNNSSEETRQSYGQAGPSARETMADGAFQTATEGSTFRGPGSPSTSGSEFTSEDEVIRLLNCTDHYTALGFSRFESIDVSILKKEYKKKAMLVHPDKNLGNERAAEAFKKLQNAYEILLDSLKRKTYDDELRREELLNYFRRFQNAPQKKGSRGIFRPGFSHSEAEYEGPYGEARRIACKKCNDYHVWICTAKSKSQARWCQECKELHQAKDGDGWVEQSFQPLLFGLLQKMDPPSAYVCAGSKVFDVTEWFICQGMRCPVNTHKPSFHVNSSLAKETSSKGTTGTKGGSVPANEFSETMTEEEFFEWLQNAVQSGLFEANNTANDSPSAASASKNSSKKRRKGKKQW